MKSLPKLVITDIDGVWTDGGMYYDNLGNEWKKFNTTDSAGVLFARFLDIPVVIILISEVAYIGDDINDIQLLKKVGLSATPNNAPKYIKDKVDFVTSKKGGEGAFREFIEIIIQKFSNIDIVLEHYYNSSSKRYNQ